MPDYEQIDISEFVRLAEQSSSELGAHGHHLWDHLSGHKYWFSDTKTPLFLASARAIVLELAQRINGIIQASDLLIDEQDQRIMTLEADKKRRPPVVCLCGSTRFSEAFQQANLEETLAGKIVLTIGCDMRSNAELFAGQSEETLAHIKTNLDMLHLRKIDLADEILILNVGGYIGESTRRELEYALDKGKIIRFLEAN